MSLYLKGFRKRVKNLESQTTKGNAFQVATCLRFDETSKLDIVHEVTQKIRKFVDYALDSSCTPDKWDESYMLDDPYFNTAKNE